MLSLAAKLLSWCCRRLPSSLPSGMRVCAIGDVHGCLAIFGHLLERIEADFATRRSAPTQIVILGDFIDRGPDSAALVDLLRWFDDDPRIIVLIGNHEALAVAALRGRTDALEQWLAIGGDAALESWGVPLELLDGGSLVEIAAAALATVPPDVVDWLERRPSHLVIGDYLFVHAGIRPGVALEDQAVPDMLGIREAFLDSRADHGLMVVHGHSAAEKVQQRRNRIGIDTGAYWTGRLTALCLEGSDRWLIST